MRTAWLLQGLGFLILFLSLLLFLENKETIHPGPGVRSNNHIPMKTHSITLRSPAFTHGEAIPSKYTCDGENSSPPLAIDAVPENTASLVLIVEDPDVPKNIREDGTWDHWVLFNIPPETRLLAEGEVPRGAMAGTTTSNTGTYVGPCPPDGSHRYYFNVYALDTVLRIPLGSTKKEVLEAMDGHVLGSGALMGTYARSRHSI